MVGELLTRDKLHRTYGGELNLFDYEGHHTMSTMAQRIFHDWRFDNTCKANCKFRGLKKGYKNSDEA